MDNSQFLEIWNKKSPTHSPAGPGSAYPNRPTQADVTVGDKLVQSAISFGKMIIRASALNPKVILEIGTGKGVSGFFYDELLAGEGLIITLNNNDQIDMEVTEIKSECHRLIFDSGTPEALSAVKEILGDRKVDFLFIDGDHGVFENGYNPAAPFLRDYENYWPLVRSGGMAGFHDCEHNSGIRETYDRHPGEKEFYPIHIALGVIIKN